MNNYFDSIQGQEMTHTGQEMTSEFYENINNENRGTTTADTMSMMMKMKNGESQSQHAQHHPWNDSYPTAQFFNSEHYHVPQQQQQPPGGTARDSATTTAAQQHFFHQENMQQQQFNNGQSDSPYHTSPFHHHYQHQKHDHVNVENGDIGEYNVKSASESKSTSYYNPFESNGAVQEQQLKFLHQRLQNTSKFHHGLASHSGGDNNGLNDLKGQWMAFQPQEKQQQPPWYLQQSFFDGDDTAYHSTHAFHQQNGILDERMVQPQPPPQQNQRQRMCPSFAPSLQHSQRQRINPSFSPTPQQPQYNYPSDQPSVFIPSQNAGNGIELFNHLQQTAESHAFPSHTPPPQMDSGFNTHQPLSPPKLFSNDSMWSLDSRPLLREDFPVQSDIDSRGFFDFAQEKQVPPYLPQGVNRSAQIDFNQKNLEHSAATLLRRNGNEATLDPSSDFPHDIQIVREKACVDQVQQEQPVLHATLPQPNGPMADDTTMMQQQQHIAPDERRSPSHTESNSVTQKEAEEEEMLLTNKHQPESEPQPESEREPQSESERERELEPQSISPEQNAHGNNDNDLKMKKERVLTAKQDVSDDTADQQCKKPEKYQNKKKKKKKNKKKKKSDRDHKKEREDAVKQDEALAKKLQEELSREFQEEQRSDELRRAEFEVIMKDLQRIDRDLGSKYDSECEGLSVVSIHNIPAHYSKEHVKRLCLALETISSIELTASPTNTRFKNAIVQFSSAMHAYGVAITLDDRKVYKDIKSPLEALVELRSEGDTNQTKKFEKREDAVDDNGDHEQAEEQPQPSLQDNPSEVTDEASTDEEGMEEEEEYRTSKFKDKGAAPVSSSSANVFTLLDMDDDADSESNDDGYETDEEIRAAAKRLQSNKQPVYHDANGERITKKEHDEIRKRQKRKAKKDIKRPQKDSATSTTTNATRKKKDNKDAQMRKVRNEREERERMEQEKLTYLRRDPYNFLRPCKDYFSKKHFCKWGPECPFTHDRDIKQQYEWQQRQWEWSRRIYGSKSNIPSVNSYMRKMEKLQPNKVEEEKPSKQQSKKKHLSAKEMYSQGTPLHKKVFMCPFYGSKNRCLWNNLRKCNFVHMSDPHSHDEYQEYLLGKYANLMCACSPYNDEPVMFDPLTTNPSEIQMKLTQEAARKEQQYASNFVLTMLGLFEMRQSELCQKIPQLQHATPRQHKDSIYTVFFPDTGVVAALVRQGTRESRRIRDMFEPYEDLDEAGKNRRDNAERVLLHQQTGSMYDADFDKSIPMWCVLGYRTHQVCTLRWLEKHLSNITFIAPFLEHHDSRADPYKYALYGERGYVPEEDDEEEQTIMGRIYEHIMDLEETATDHHTGEDEDKEHESADSAASNGDALVYMLLEELLMHGDTSSLDIGFGVVGIGEGML